LSCTISPATTVPANFDFYTTNPTTNRIIEPSFNAPVNIAQGAAQTFLIEFFPNAPFPPTTVNLTFGCANASPAPSITGVNTLLYSISTTPVPDVIALGATASNDGILHISGSNGVGAFAVATFNLEAASAITASANTGGASLPLSLAICQTNPASGQCLSAAGPSVTTTITQGCICSSSNANSTPTFSIFAGAAGVVPFDPANNRIFLQFTDPSGAVRGETSVAVETQ
jgi:hypothetical protein